MLRKRKRGRQHLDCSSTKLQIKFNFTSTNYTTASAVSAIQSIIHQSALGLKKKKKERKKREETTLIPQTGTPLAIIPPNLNTDS
jgi:hypothetical protein